jgi:peptidoglycan/LPS O-acetylase OafA/YrhL
MGVFSRSRDHSELKPKGVATVKGEIAYRPDIDGLRAIAVLLVVFSHLEIPHLLGGFVGVDIFFVISGYLITGNIARLIEGGRFSIGGFYERRFRRILPALFVMLVATSILAYILFLPQQLIEYGQALLAAFFSYSNLYLYWTKSGYFGIIFTHILLHTWSLGVEEQFYLFIPLGMLAVAHRPRLMRCAVATIAAISFITASYFAIRTPNLAFYLPYTRAWELLSGAMISLGMFRFPTSRSVREALVILGIALIALCAIFYRPWIPFPGVTALPPCVAAVLLILVGESGETSLNRVLSWPPFVFIGLISYSLYLWHWPLVVLLRLGAIHGIRDRTWSGNLFVIVVSILMASLSWRFVEQPFRAGRLRKLSRRRVLETVGVCAPMVIGYAVLLNVKGGFPTRFPPTALAMSQYMEAHTDMRNGTCFVENGFSQFDRTECLQELNGKKNVLLFGDSHAAALWWGLKEQFPEVHFLQATLASCPPTEGSYRRSDCSKMRRYIYEEFLSKNRVDGVVLSERWASCEDLHQMKSALHWFQNRGIPVTVVGPVPEYTAPLPYLLALGRKWGDPGLAGRNRVTGLRQLDQYLKKQLDNQVGITYASAWDAICDHSGCAEYADDRGMVPMLSDLDHLTKEGSVALAGKLKQAGVFAFNAQRRGKKAAVPALSAAHRTGTF